MRSIPTAAISIVVLSATFWIVALFVPAELLSSELWIVLALCVAAAGNALGVLALIRYPIAGQKLRIAALVVVLCGAFATLALAASSIWLPVVAPRANDDFISLLSNIGLRLNIIIANLILAGGGLLLGWLLFGAARLLGRRHTA